MSKLTYGLRWAAGTAMLAGALSVGAVGLASADADWRLLSGDEHHEEDKHSTARQTDNSPQRKLYVAECAACHMAYPAGFLPERSWLQIMQSLDDHFGENAELDSQSQQVITRYLIDNAGEKSSNRRALKFMRSLSDNETPLRITQTRYFKRKHDEVTARYVEDNPDVGSFSQCQACHGDKAELGYFNDDTVDIPNFGRWDD